MVIEEAAGVLKFRRRRERAERRLESSEQNLLRLQDLQREVRRQLRPLERQAEAARRHDGLVAELRALRLHLAGRELELARAAARERRAFACRAHRAGGHPAQRAGTSRRPGCLDRVGAHRGAGLGRGGPARACRAPARAPARCGERGCRAAPHRRRVARGRDRGGRRRLARGRVVPPCSGPVRRRGGCRLARARTRGAREARGRAAARRGDVRGGCRPGRCRGCHRPGTVRGPVRHCRALGRSQSPVNSTTRRSPGCRPPGRRWRDWPSGLPVSIACATEHELRLAELAAELEASKIVDERLRTEHERLARGGAGCRGT